MTRLIKLERLKDKARRRSEKRTHKKTELAVNAIEVLKQLGYARTSLRDIAEHSGVSVGILHYYFEDKVDLISFCVQKYKEDFINEMDEILLASSGAEAIVEGFSHGLSETIRTGAETHRLWYDIRTQALFEENFHGVVAEIEYALILLVERLLGRLGIPKSDALQIYLTLDGAFRYCLQRTLSGDKTATQEFYKLVKTQLSSMITRG
ncbi:MAG: TetR/AcrR family transcriptional regulator [Hyphomicrobiales bacterium]|nr:TetR/AcrR family transcriptional regulator [Hyphomicrobiales bacterium]